jgi:Na+-transporting NADH:ubiquinone oxidoreductase subunit B
MKFLRNFLDRIEPTFKEGKLKSLYTIYEAIDTFLYTPGETTKSEPHIRDSIDLKRLMSLVLVALGPCIFMAFYNTGYQANAAIQNSASVSAIAGWRTDVMQALGCGFDPHRFLDNLVHGGLYFLPSYLVTMAVGGAWEFLFAAVRRHEINEGFLVTGILFPLTLPPTTPLWQVALGISFGVVFGKEIFGGTGKNIWNPALTGRAFLYFAYPAYMTGNSIWTSADGFSGATPLGALADAKVDDGMSSVIDVSWMQAFLGNMQGSMGETSTLACLIGAAILIGTGIGSWRIMSAVTAGAAVASGIFYLLPGDHGPLFHLAPWWHLVLGGFAFGTVFMATDPVSAAMTRGGQWLYGVLIGVVTILIRVINPAYPEGIMLAILFGNTFAPLIDYYVIQLNVKRRKVRYET